jgi:hypothetical protein
MQNFVWLVSGLEFMRLIYLVIGFPQFKMRSGNNETYNKKNNNSFSPPPPTNQKDVDC